jgi:diguanylate cyclase (GGDEF)-like protein
MIETKKAISVLNIDRDPEHRQRLREILVSRFGEATTFAFLTGSSEELQSIGKDIYDVIFLADQLEEISGLGALQVMRQAGVETPIIFVSTQKEDYLADTVTRAGATAFLAKDEINEKTVFQTLEMIEQSRLQPSTQEQSVSELPDYQALAQSLAAESIDLLIQARIDDLTGTLSRTAFLDTVTEEHKCCLKSDKIYCIAIIEIDHFRSFNDTAGRGCADDCLKRIASALQGVIRGTDFLGRYGGAQFALLLTDTSLEQSEFVGNRLVRTVQEEAIPHPGLAADALVTISVGITQLNGQSHEDVIERAEQALNKAKSPKDDQCDVNSPNTR